MCVTMWSNYPLESPNLTGPSSLDTIITPMQCLCLLSMCFWMNCLYMSCTARHRQHSDTVHSAYVCWVCLLSDFLYISHGPAVIFCTFLTDLSDCLYISHGPGPEYSIEYLKHTLLDFLPLSVGYRHVCSSHHTKSLSLSLWPLSKCVHFHLTLLPY
jgi:hypothetical protein